MNVQLAAAADTTATQLQVSVQFAQWDVVLVQCHLVQ